jgi:hypothetical protein
MRILNKRNGETINSVVLMLTPEEAKRLVDLVSSIKPEEGDHIHIDDLESSREITILVYTPQNLNFFNEAVRKTINED